jgi:hypothetical protein
MAKTSPLVNLMIPKLAREVPMEPVVDQVPDELS